MEEEHPGTDCTHFHLDFIGSEGDEGRAEEESLNCRIGCSGWALPAVLCTPGLSPRRCSRSRASTTWPGLRRKASHTWVQSVPVAKI